MSMFMRRQFPVEIILLCVRWFCKYAISDRDLAEMIATSAALTWIIRRYQLNFG